VFVKVIFLDIDGVLNSVKTVYRSGFDFIDPVLVSLLSDIVKATGAEIVLSSTWRLCDKDLNLVKNALYEYNMSLIGVTPYLSSRNEEIREWMVGKAVLKFAILDDMKEAGIGFGDNFFRTDESRGLTVEIAESVIKHLGVQPSIA